MKLSRKFLACLKLHELPAYKLAQLAGVNPNTLSKLVTGIEPLKPSDSRIISVGRLLSLSPSDCFEAGHSN
jgi:hypothetical protein